MDQIVFCSKCGQECGPDVAFCFKCGTPVRTAAAAPTTDPEPVPESEPTPHVRVESAVRCLACGSRDVHAEKRGWKWTTGLIGSGKIMLTCLRCGHQQRPGDRNPNRYQGGRFKA